MKHRFKNRVLSLVLSVCMMMPIMTQAMPVYSVDDEVETLGAFTTPFTEDTPIYIGDSTEPVYSKSYRIPSMVTLNDGTIDMAAFLHRASELCPDATYTFELPEARSSMDWLREMGVI